MATLGDAGADPLAHGGPVLGCGREARLGIACTKKVIERGFLGFHFMLLQEPQGGANNLAPVVVAAGLNEVCDELFLSGGKGDAHVETLAKPDGKVNFPSVFNLCFICG